jgi:4-hydroxy-tetrahydrodipicolinate synthase
VTLQIGGCGTALVTPFDIRGRIDFGRLERLADWQIREGADFLLPCLATGEAATMSGDERKAVIKKVAEVASGRVPVAAGAGGNHTAKVVLWARDAEKAGADAIVSIMPPYNQPTAEGLLRHFTAISEATSLPIVASNVPRRAGVDIDIDTILRLAEIPRVAALKEASTDLSKIARLMARLPAEFAVFSGDDVTALPLLALGGRGVVSVAANEIPKEMAALVHAALAGRLDEARGIQKKWLPLMEVNSLEMSPGPVKCALTLMGRCEESFRLPLVPVREETRKRIEKLLRGYKLIGKA